MSLRIAMTMSDRLLYTATEACQVLGVNMRTFRAEIAPHLLPVRVKSTWRYPRSELVRWVDRNKQQHADSIARDV